MATTLSASERSLVVAEATEQKQAQDLLVHHGGETMVVEFKEHHHVTQVPAELTAIISQVLEVMAKGGTITIGSMPDELTTTIAAEQLGVSRPTLMKMIHAGELPARKVGTHHRIRTVDVLALKQARLERQRRAFDELRRLEDELTPS